MDTLSALERVRAAVPVRLLLAFHPLGHVDEYVKFLALKLLRGDVDALPPALSPSHLVDQVWRTHMMHPHMYMATCRALLAHLHAHRQVVLYAHTPLMDVQRYRKTLEVYAEVFGVAPSPVVWPAAEAEAPVVAAVARDPSPPSSPVRIVSPPPRVVEVIDISDDSGALAAESTTPTATSAASAEERPTPATDLVTPSAADGSRAADPSAAVPTATRAAKRSADPSPSRKRMTLHVKTPSGETHALMMAADTTVSGFKRHIMHATGIAPDEQRLVYGPLVLRNPTYSLEHYNLQHHSVVRMTRRES